MGHPRRKIRRLLAQWAMVVTMIGAIRHHGELEIASPSPLPLQSVLLLLLFLLGGLSSLNAGIVESRAFASNPERERARGTLFTELDPERTGLSGFVNEYGSSQMWGDRWREYIIGTIGTGVAVGDVTGNGFPDIFVVSKDEESRLYENLGDFRFRDITKQSGIVKGREPAGGAAFVDINNNGRLDIYICYVGGPNQLWINDGTGRFTERAAEWGLDVVTGSVMAVFADYDGDGYVDMYLVTNLVYEDGEYTEPLPDHLFRNLGDRFVEVTEDAGISGAGYGHAAVWWDFNGNGRPDLYVANDFDPLDRLYLNQGDGTFIDAIGKVSPQAPYFSMGVDFGDINNNGRFDLWGTDMKPLNRSLFHRTVGSRISVYEGAERRGTHQYMKNVLLLNMDDSRLAEIAFLAGLDRTDWTWAARLVDLNNNGWLDGFVSNGMIRMFNDADIGTQIEGVAAQRVEAAFRPSPILRERNLAFRNEGDLTFTNQSESWGFTRKTVSFGAAFADLNGNGALDLVVNNYKEPPSIFRNNEAENNRVTLRLRGSESNSHGIGARVTVTAGELRQVKMLMPHRGYMGSDEPILHFGLSREERIDVLDIQWPSGIRQRLTGLEVNRRYTIEEEATPGVADPAAPSARFTRAEAEFPIGTARRETDSSGFSAQPLLPFAESRLGGVVAAGDLDGNGQTDLVLGGRSGQEAAVLANRGNLRFESLWSLDLEGDFLSEDMDLALADMTGDGFFDLVGASGSVELAPGDEFYADRLYLNRGDGEFEREFGAAFSRARVSTGAVAVGDFTGDGRPDVFLGGRAVPGRYPYAPESSLWQNTVEGFVRVDPELAPGLAEAGRVTAADWVDLDGNGRLDLVLQREWASPMIWRNREGRLEHDTKALEGEALSGLWAAQAFGDFNGNGRIDIAVGNLGLNTQYRASVDAPMGLWHSDNREGPVRLIETLFDGGREYPVAVKNRLRQEFPREIRRVQTYREFGESTVEEIFGDLRERGFRKAEITEVRTGILWQQEDGRFRFEPLPSFAQSGRVMGMLAADITGNELPDLVLSLELHSPEPWTGRIERGYLALLINRGDGTFEAEMPYRSGLSIGKASPRGLAWADLTGDGRKELVVYLSDGEPLIFSPRGD